jgi:enoyl-CoA hydratase/carnithine racemase
MSPVNLTADGHLLTIELDRPAARHALDWATLELLHVAFTRLNEDDELWAGVLTATGTTSFCAGADLKTLPEETARKRREGIAPPSTILHDLTVDKPLICALNGDAHGGGVELALACDLRIAADHVTLALPEARVGLVPAGGATYRLPALVGRSRALQMMFTGTPVDADTALRWGLVDRVVPAQDLRAATGELAADILRCAPLATRAIKRLVGGTVAADQRRQLAAESQALAAIQATADAAEGVAAFRQRREPAWGAR